MSAYRITSSQHQRRLPRCTRKSKSNPRRPKVESWISRLESKAIIFTWRVGGIFFLLGLIYIFLLQDN